MNSTPTPAEQVAALKKMKALPDDVRQAALTLAGTLGAERAVLYQKKIDTARELGEAARKARELGVSYEEQAELIGVHRNTLYSSGGTVERGSRQPRGNQLHRALAEVVRLGKERAEVTEQFKANSEAMKDLVRYTYNSIVVPLDVLSARSKLSRSTLYGWLGRTHFNPRTNADGQRTRRIDPEPPDTEVETPLPRKPGGTGGRAKTRPRSPAVAGGKRKKG